MFREGRCPSLDLPHRGNRFSPAPSLGDHTDELAPGGEGTGGIMMAVMLPALPMGTNTHLR